jgi:hypothetical protein
MNEKRKYGCKAEEVPAIGGYLAQRLRADLNDFTSFSSFFSRDYIVQLEAQTAACIQVIVSDVLTKEISEITKQIGAKTKSLRLDVNKVEVYFNMADGEMTVAADMMGVKQLRASISNGNMEGVAVNGHRLLSAINTNLTVLQAKGLKPALVEEMTQLVNDIEKLGNDQNFKITERNRHTDDNISTLNGLWDMISFILETGRALYRGVNDTKLNDYTLTTILKRINAEGSNPKPEAPKA